MTAVRRVRLDEENNTREPVDLGSRYAIQTRTSIVSLCQPSAMSEPRVITHNCFLASARWRYGDFSRARSSCYAKS